MNLIIRGVSSEITFLKLSTRFPGVNEFYLSYLVADSHSIRTHILCINMCWYTENTPCSCLIKYPCYSSVKLC